LLIPRVAFTAAAAAGKAKGSIKNDSQERKKETLALVGCGKMGLAMGRNFLKAGYPLLVLDKHNAEAVAKLVAEVRRARGKSKGTRKRRMQIAALLEVYPPIFRSCQHAITSYHTLDRERRRSRTHGSWAHKPAPS
jgi:Zn-dependent alcohol dehydrogenase